MTINNRRIRVNDVELNIVTQGEGPAVLLVHGFPDDHTVWRNQIPARSSRARATTRSRSLWRIWLHYSMRSGSQKCGSSATTGGRCKGWCFAVQHPKRVDRYIAMSVGHPGAYVSAGLAQKLKGYYLFCIQLRGLIEFLVTRFDWWLFGLLLHYPAEFPHIRARLSRPGRLTAGFNYYRANLRSMHSKVFPRVKVPVVGIWSDSDIFLTEDQMSGSERYCDAGFRYFRIDGANHWLQLTTPEKLNPLLLQLLH